MRNKLLIITSSLVLLSLVGLITIQVIWLKQSWAISEEQYDDRVDRMLDNVVDELIEYADTVHKGKNKVIFDVLDTALLEELMYKYIDYHNIDTPFYHAIVKTKNKELIYKSEGYDIKLHPKSYKSCLSCIWKKEYMHISVFFPGKKKEIIKGVSSYALLSVLFIILVSLAFVYMVFGVFRQKKISQLKNDFINNMTHEFKTPISTISIANDILKNNMEQLKPSIVNKYLTIIQDENLRMQNQVELVLQIACIEKGQLQLNKEEVEIHELIRRTVDKFVLNTMEKKVKVKYDFEAENKVARVEILHMQNVIRNLIDNAIKYSGQDVFIEVATNDVENGIVIQVKDKGIGIKKEDMDKIFDKFHRIGSGDIHNVKGFGLGLYYVKNILSLHGGKVWVDSNLNKGSTFSVYIPT